MIRSRQTVDMHHSTWTVGWMLLFQPYGIWGFDHRKKITGKVTLDFD